MVFIFISGAFFGLLLSFGILALMVMVIMDEEASRDDELHQRKLKAVYSNMPSPQVSEVTYH
jgi:translation elongation factor EF-1beta